MLLETLSFGVVHEYDPGIHGISVPVELAVGNRQARTIAKLDTGATYCIFERGLGEALGLDIEGGPVEEIGTATGSFWTHGHHVSLLSLGFSLDIVAYFAHEPTFNRNVLGRHGWLQLLRIGIVDYDGKLYVSRYGSQ